MTMCSNEWKSLITPPLTDTKTDVLNVHVPLHLLFSMCENERVAWNTRMCGGFNGYRIEQRAVYEILTYLLVSRR